jgi:uncharacterized protein (UPF0264 family)
MDNLSRFRDSAGLLVSVRNRDEAETALTGGADVIDIKEPSRGSLGAADAESIAAVVDVVDGRVPISVAAGELLDWPVTRSPQFIDAVVGRVSFIKFGLAGCIDEHNWPTRWRSAIDAFCGTVQPVAVAYADWRAACAPTPADVLAHAIACGCPVLLIDTWSKSVGDLFDRLPAESMTELARRVRAAGIHLALAGSLKQSSLAEAVRYRPSLLAVRGAACEGDRIGKISLARVAALRAALDAAQFVGTGSIS